MTNPGNAVGTNAAYGGRTSANAFNDLANFYSRGIVSGWLAAPSSGMAITVGGTAGIRDVALAQDNNGNKTTVDNISGQPVPVTLAAASATSARMDCVVAYVNANPHGVATVVDNPSACGLIAVSGSSSSYPNDSAIRAAITSDGGSGSTAYYVVLAYVTVAANTTDISADMITQGDNAQLGSHSVDFATLGKVVSDTSATVNLGNQTTTLSFSCNVTRASSSAGSVYIAPLSGIQNLRQSSGNLGSGFSSGEFITYSGGESRLPLLRGENTNFTGSVSVLLNIVKTAFGISIFAKASMLSASNGYSATVESRASLSGSPTSLTLNFSKDGTTVSGAQWVALPF